MQNIKIMLNAEIGYESLAIQDKIILPIEAGKWTILKYRQHSTNPLSVESISLHPLSPDQLQILFRLTGILKVNLFPDLKLGGAELRVQARLRIRDKNPEVSDLKIVTIKLRHLPQMIANLFRKHLNQKLAAHFRALINRQIKTIFSGTRELMRTANRFELQFDAKTWPCEFQPNGRQSAIGIELTPECIRLQIAFTLKPTIRECA